jgi:hypothetical protein
VPENLFGKITDEQRDEWSQRFSGTRPWPKRAALVTAPTSAKEHNCGLDKRGKKDNNPADHVICFQMPA